MALQDYGYRYQRDLLRGQRVYRKRALVRKPFIVAGVGAAVVGAWLLLREPLREEPAQISIRKVEQTIETIPRSPIAALGAKLREEMLEARRLLSRKEFLCEAGKDGSETVWIAAFNLKTHATEAIRLVKKPNGGGVRIIDSSKRFRVELVSGNGVNSEYEIKHPPSYVPLALKMGFKMTRREGKMERVVVVYTPFDSIFFENSELLNSGADYLTQLVQRARDSLVEFGSNRVAERVQKISRYTAFLMILNEHVDPFVFQKQGVGWQVNRELALLGANEGEAYNYGVSSGAGARGLCQLIRSTYYSLLARYEREVELNPDFYAGTADHANSARFQLLLHADDLYTLSLNKAIDESNEREVVTKLAAAYNAGVDDVIRAVKRFGENWSEPPQELLDERTELQDEAKELKEIMKNPFARRNAKTFFEHYAELRDYYSRRQPSRKAVKRFNAEFPPHANVKTARRLLERRMKEIREPLESERLEGMLPDETLVYVRKVEALLNYVGGDEEAIFGAR